MCNLSILQAAPGNLNPNPNLKQPSTRAITAEQLTGVALAVAMGVEIIGTENTVIPPEERVRELIEEKIEGAPPARTIKRVETVLTPTQRLLLVEKEIEAIKSELRNKTKKKAQKIGEIELFLRIELQELRVRQIESLLELAGVTHTQQEITELLQHLVISLEEREQEAIIEALNSELIKEMANRDIELLRQVTTVVETSKNQVGGEKTQNLLVVINNLLNSAKERFEALQVKSRKACKEREERLKRQNHQ